MGRFSIGPARRGICGGGGRLGRPCNVIHYSTQNTFEMVHTKGFSCRTRLEVDRKRVHPVDVVHEDNIVLCNDPQDNRAWFEAPILLFASREANSRVPSVLSSP